MSYNLITALHRQTTKPEIVPTTKDYKKSRLIFLKIMHKPIMLES